MLTMAKYQSPAGTEIDGVGVVPNVQAFLGSSILPPLLDADVDQSIHAAMHAQAELQGKACVAPSQR